MGAYMSLLKISDKLKFIEHQGKKSSGCSFSISGAQSKLSPVLSAEFEP